MIEIRIPYAVQEGLWECKWTTSRPTKQKYKVVLFKGMQKLLQIIHFFKHIYQMADFVEIYNAIIFILQVLILVCELREMILTWVNKASKDHSLESVCMVYHSHSPHNIYDHRCVSFLPKFSILKLKTEVQI